MKRSGVADLPLHGGRAPAAKAEAQTRSARPLPQLWLKPPFEPIRRDAISSSNTGGTLETFARVDRPPRPALPYGFTHALRSCSAGRPSAGQPGDVSVTPLAHHRPVPRRTHALGRRRSAAAERLLHRRVQRRRVEDHRLRPHLAADLRRPAHRLHRRDRGRAVRSRTSSTSAAAKDCSGPTSPSATASTNPPTPARPGRTSACATASRSRRSPSIRAIRTGSSSPCSAIRTARTRSAASTAPPMAARPSKKVLYKDENTGAQRRR